jgi:acyl-CoA synthetase (AMP-forming)/AMP-acid ligase II
MRRGGPPTWSSARDAFSGRATQNPEVQIYRYVTEESFDAYMWQTLETKAKFIAQVMTAK